MARRGGDKLFSKNKELDRKAFERQQENKNRIPDVIAAVDEKFWSDMDKVIERAHLLGINNR